MNIDFHFHASLSKKTGFLPEHFENSLHEARRIGLTCIGLTDHFNVFNFEAIYEFLDATYPYQGAYYDADGLRLFPGMEVDVAEGPHLLLVGEREQVYYFHRQLAGFKEKGHHIPIAQYFERQAGLSFLNIFAHPFRPGREAMRVPVEYLANFHAFDLNGKDMYTLGRENQADVYDLAATHHRKVTAGSDAHHFHQLGCVYNQFHHPLNNVQEIIQYIETGEYTIYVDEALEEMVQTAERVKSGIKANWISRNSATTQDEE
ncbi:MAG: histidinol-phosphatase [Anaerolineales bacterium]|nr:histidinol-phosphatase [Anaerolineales bacterium]